MKLYREDQKYHDAIAIGMIGMLSVLLLVTVFSQSASIWKIALGLVIIGGAFWVVKNLRLKIRISKKKISVRINPLPWTRISVPKQDITGVEFIAATGAEIANGWAVHYGAKLQLFNFGDNKGMVIHTNKGEGIVILSAKLFENQSQIVEELKAHGYLQA